MYKVQPGQQSFGRHQATPSSNGRFAQSLGISTATLKFATISDPKAAFLERHTEFVLGQWDDAKPETELYNKQNKTKHNTTKH